MIEPLTLQLCDRCGGEGKLYTSRYGGNDPDVWPIGECPVCEGTGSEIIEVESVEEEEIMDEEMMAALEKDGEMLRQVTGEDHGPWAMECAIGCQYAKDVGMPEHSCGSGCMYLRKQEGIAEALGGESAANERTPIKDTQHD